MADDLSAGSLVTLVYDHTRFYTNAKLTEWEECDTQNPVMILLERTYDLFHLKGVINVARVLCGNKIRYIYLDDLKLVGG